MDAKELRSKSEQELREELHALLKEQFNLRMQKAIVKRRYCEPRRVP